MASKPGLKPPNQALNMMAQRNSDTKGVDCQWRSSNCATMTVAATKRSVIAYLQTTGGLDHHRGLDFHIPLPLPDQTSRRLPAPRGWGLLVFWSRGRTASCATAPTANSGTARPAAAWQILFAGCPRTPTFHHPGDLLATALQLDAATACLASRFCCHS